MVTKVDKIKIKAVFGIVYIANVTVNWTTFGVGPPTKQILLGQEAEWNLDEIGIPEDQPLWALIQAVAGTSATSDKNEFVYNKGSGVTAVFEITGTTFNIVISSSIEKD